jgi:hypothetical protein
VNAATISQQQRFSFGTPVAIATVFFAVSMLQVSVPGINEPHYICKARAYLQPEWCANDFFLQSRSVHVVYFAVTGWLLQFLSLPAVAVVGRVMGAVLLSAGWTLLGRQFGLRSLSSILAAVLFAGIALTGNFSGEWVIGGYESKVPSYGFALMGCALWIACRERFRYSQAVSAGACLGAAISLHPVVGTWFLIGVGMSETWLLVAALIKGRSQHHQASVATGPTTTAATTPAFTGPAFVVRRGVVLLLSAIVVSLPGLIPALRVVTSDAVGREQRHLADFIQVFGRLKHHLDPSTFPLFVWVHSGILLAVIGVSWIVLRRMDRRSATDSADDGTVFTGSAMQRWLLLGIMSVVIALVGIAIGWHSAPAKDIPFWQTRALLLKFYPFRFVDAMLPMTCAFLLAAVAQRLCSGRQQNANDGTPVPKRRYLQLAIIVLGATTLTAAAYQRTSAPSIYSEQDFELWKTACRWIDQNTPDDSLFLTPRESFAFKWFAGRAEYVCYKDCPQDAAGILEWNRRLGVIHSWSFTSFQDQQYDRSDLVELRQQTGVAFLMTRKLGPFVDAPVYDDGVWRIYECPTAE